MLCDTCQATLGARLDGELTAEEAREIDRHLRRARRARGRSRLWRDPSPRIGECHAVYRTRRAQGAHSRRGGASRVASSCRRPAEDVSWWREVAAGVAIAIMSSGVTFIAANRSSARSSAADELLASHVRSLMPGHLTDVPSTEQHTSNRGSTVDWMCRRQCRIWIKTASR